MSERQDYALGYGLVPISETTDLSETTYSRSETITAFREYYQFLQTMYLSSSSVLQPPAGGWPEITVLNMRWMGKTDEVVALLRELPYIVRSNDDTRIHCR